MDLTAAAIGALTIVARAAFWVFLVVLRSDQARFWT